MKLNEMFQLASAHHQAGRFTEAEALYHRVLQANPKHSDANHNLGLMFMQLNRAERGLPYLQAAWEADPSIGQYWLTLTECLLEMGHPEDARLLIEDAIRRGMESPQAQQLLMRAKDSQANKMQLADTVAGAVEALAAYSGTNVQCAVQSNAANQQASSSPVLQNSRQLSKVKSSKLDQLARKSSLRQGKGPSPQKINALASLFNKGRYTEAATLAQTMTERFPLHGFGWKVSGAVYKQMGRIADALIPMQKAAALSPNDVEAHSNLGVTFKELGRLNEAEASLRLALQIKPDFAEAHNNLGITLQEQYRLGEAEVSYRRALQIKPDYAEAHNNLGVILNDLGRLDEAETSYRRALEIKPDYAEGHNNLGNTLQGMGRLDEAEESCRRALQIKPDYAEAHNNLGNTLQGMGRLDEADASYRRALEIKPGYVDAHSNLIFTLDMSAGTCISELHAERKKWGDIHAAHLLQHHSHTNAPDPERRLRVGYVSADFKMHSAASAFGAMLFNFDRSRFDVIAYSNTIKEDVLTERFRESATCWRKIIGLSDEAVAGLIRQDKIDILVDLSGFSADNRLLVFARKPAPLQITAWGYAAGTGLPAMDVLFSDAVVVPPDEARFYTEQIRYLPCLLTYSTYEAPPAVNELPALSTGAVTFGSFNRLVKISDEAYRAWAQVLLAVPGSRMVLKTGELDDAATRARVTGHFTRAGVAPERLSLLGKTSWPDHMAAFNRIDISLDTFPQGGGVTTLEGLLMGVPLVTLRWPTLSGRTSASILTTLGLTDWIAETPEQYVEIALRKARDISALAELRRQMRDRFMSSVIGDTEAYTRIVEQEYRQLWREWCGRK